MKVVHLRRVLAASAALSALTASGTAQGRLEALRRDRAAARGRAAAGASESIALAFQGMARRYLLHAPANATGPLVLAFHGGSETPENLESISGLDALADRHGFIVAYPEGIGRSWADGRGTTDADRHGIDDVGFARAVVADIARAHAVDPLRVYATGPSNGGIFANRLGCDAAETFAAIGPVIGTLPSALIDRCRPSAPIAVAGIQGVADPVVPFNGGEVGGPLKGAAGGTVASSRATQDVWRTANGCAAAADITSVPVRVHDGTSITRRAYRGCRGGADVVWYEIQGGGHRWPPHQSTGIEERLAARELGASSQNIDAAETLWQFFAAHPKH